MIPPPLFLSYRSPCLLPAYPSSPLPNLDNFPLSRVIPQQLLDEINVREDHATAAVAVQAEFVHRFAIQR